MPRGTITEEMKMTILEVIKSKKDLLFGKFTSQVENADIEKAWREVLEKTKSIGACPANRDSVFVRDSLWGNWKTRTLKKRDNKKKTGKAGGREKLLTPVDEMILDIIGRETPNVMGLQVPQSGVPMPRVSIERNNVDDDDHFDYEPQRSPPDSPSSRRSLSRNLRSRSPSPRRDSSPNLPSTSATCRIRPIPGSTTPENLQSLPVTPDPPEVPAARRRKSNAEILKRKRDLQIEYLEAQVYASKLKTLKLERELGVPPGELTKSIVEEMQHSVTVITLQHNE